MTILSDGVLAMDCLSNNAAVMVEAYDGDPGERRFDELERAREDLDDLLKIAQRIIIDADGALSAVQVASLQTAITTGTQARGRLTAAILSVERFETEFISAHSQIVSSITNRWETGRGLVDDAIERALQLRAESLSDAETPPEPAPSVPVGGELKDFAFNQLFVGPVPPLAETVNMLISRIEQQSAAVERLDPGRYESAYRSLGTCALNAAS